MGFEPLRRALAVTRAALAEERRRDPAIRRHRDDVAFLPAVLEVLETPVSPAGRALAWSLMALFAIALAWAAVGRVDVVAVAEGKLVPAGRTKVIQPLEAGVVRRIAVEDGQHVAAGQTLIELDPTQAAADESNLSTQWMTARVEEARYAAEAAAVNGPGEEVTAGAEAAAAFAPPAEAPAALVAANRRLLQADLDDLRSKLATWNAEIEKQEADRAAAAATVSTLDKTLPLLREQVAAREELVRQGYAPRLDLLERQRQLQSQEGEGVVQRQQVLSATAAAESGRRQRRQAVAAFLRDAMASREEADKKAAGLAQDLLKATQRHGLQTLTAPIDGVVQQLAIHTVGGVVTAAQPLLAVVPDDAGLEVEAQILNRDIGFVTPGQEAEIKLETFLFTRYGTIPGRVLSLSHDAVADDKLGLIYPARIALQRTSIAADGRSIPLGPGMAATVEIKTDRRRLIEYLLSPLAKKWNESFKER